MAKIILLLDEDFRVLLAETIFESGDKVRIIDDLSNGNIENIKHLKGQQRKTEGVST